MTEAGRLAINVARVAGGHVAWCETLPDVSGLGCSEAEAIGELLLSLDKEGMLPSLAIIQAPDRRCPTKRYTEERRATPPPSRDVELEFVPINVVPFPRR